MSPVQKVKKDHSFLKACSIGCLATIVIAFLIGLAVFSGIKKAVTGLTDTEPRNLPALRYTKAQSQPVINKYDRFYNALIEGESVPALELSATEINQLLHYHPGCEGAADKIYVSIDNNTLKGEISIPLDFVPGGLTEGRYLNGSAAIDVSMNDGQMQIYLKSIELNGTTPPPEVMKEFENKNFADDVNSSPETMDALKNFKTIEVKSRRLRIVPQN